MYVRTFTRMHTFMLMYVNPTLQCTAAGETQGNPQTMKFQLQLQLVAFLQLKYKHQLVVVVATCLVSSVHQVARHIRATTGRCRKRSQD